MAETMTSSGGQVHRETGSLDTAAVDSRGQEAQAHGTAAVVSPPHTSASQQSLSGQSEASSKASSQLSKTSSATTTTSTGKNRSKAPSLDTIAARMKKTTLADRNGEARAATSVDDDDDPNDDSRTSRLPMPGRLSSTVSDKSDSSSLMMPPTAVAHGEPPVRSRGRTEGLASLRDKAASRSRSTSPTKPGKMSTSTSSSQGAGESTKAVGMTSMGKEMPSLQDIIDRMSKKGIANNSTSSGSNPPGSVKAQTGGESEAEKRPKSPIKSTMQAPQQKEREAVKLAASSASASGSTAGLKASAEIKEEKGHPLQHKWTMYFDSKSWNPSTNVAGGGKAPDTPASPAPGSAAPLFTSSASNANSWEAALKMLGVYTNVESFMSIFSTLRRPSQLERNSNFHLFKDGIKPMWEDAANQNGGKWIIMLKGTNPALLDRSWMWLVLALIGEELDENDDVTGAVVSTRSKGDRIALWIRNKTDVDLVNKIGKKFVLLLDLEKEPGVSLEFSPNSIDDGAAGGGSRKIGGHPSKFISFNNPPPFASPVFGQQGQQQQQQQQQQASQQGQHRLHPSPGKSSGPSGGPNRMGPRRGSEHSVDSHHGGFPSGLGGPIGRTLSPSPDKNGVHSSSILGGRGASILGSKAKTGLGMSPPM